MKPPSQNPAGELLMLRLVKLKYRGVGVAPKLESPQMRGGLDLGRAAVRSFGAEVPQELPARRPLAAFGEELHKNLALLGGVH